MTEIYRSGIPALTEKEIDVLVASRQSIKSWSGGYDARYCSERSKRIGGWELRVIATMGLGNCGRVIAIPRTSRTRIIWVKAQKEMLIAEYGASEHIAAAYIDAKCPSYKFEEDVIKTVLRHVANKKMLVAARVFPGIGPEKHRAWMRAWDIADSDFPLSWPRTEAVLSILSQF